MTKPITLFRFNDWIKEVTTAFPEGYLTEKGYVALTTEQDGSASMDAYELVKLKLSDQIKELRKRLREMTEHRNAWRRFGTGETFPPGIPPIDHLDWEDA